MAAHQKGVEETLRQIERQAVHGKDTEMFGAFFATKPRRLDDNCNPHLREQCMLLGVEHGDYLQHGQLHPSKLALSERHAELCYNLAMTFEMDRRFGWVRLERSNDGLEIAGVPEKLHQEFSQEPSLEPFRGYERRKSYCELRGEDFFGSWQERARKHGWSERDTESFLSRKTEQAPSQTFGQSESRSGKSETRPQGPKTQSKDQSHSR